MPPLFIKQGRFSHTNTAVEELLARQFPEQPLQVIDIWKDLIHPRDPRLHLAALRHFTPDLLSRRRSIHDLLTRTPWYIDQIARRLRRRLASAPSPHFTFQTQSIFDASLPGVPHFIYTDHTHLVNLTYPAFPRKNLLPAWWIERERQIYQRATMIFTMSDHVARSLEQDYQIPADRILCVGAGFNAPLASSSPPSPDRYASKRILFVGVEWERKGGPTLLEAFRQLRPHHPDATLTIVGCSPPIDDPGCQIVGRIPIDQVPPHYLQASIFCVPTRVEPFGIVFLEAMSSSLPVVATSIAAVPEIVDHATTGLLVPPDDPAQLAAALKTLLDDPALSARLGAAGKARSALFTWENTGTKIQAAILSHLPKTP